jgi:hypothetical protein
VTKTLFHLTLGLFSDLVQVIFKYTYEPFEEAPLLHNSIGSEKGGWKYKKRKGKKKKK